MSFTAQPKSSGWSRCLGDIQILTRLLHDVANEMLHEDTPRLFAALQALKVYCERFQDDLLVDDPAPLRLGHKFVPCDDADACLHGYVDDTELGCGQPCEAH